MNPKAMEKFAALTTKLSKYDKLAVHSVTQLLRLSDEHPEMASAYKREIVSIIDAWYEARLARIKRIKK